MMHVHLGMHSLGIATYFDKYIYMQFTNKLSHKIVNIFVKQNGVASPCAYLSDALPPLASLSQSSSHALD